jgi:hypothetical protein
MDRESRGNTYRHKFTLNEILSQNIFERKTYKNRENFAKEVSQIFLQMSECIILDHIRSE